MKTERVDCGVCRGQQTAVRTTYDDGSTLKQCESCGTGLSTSPPIKINRNVKRPS